MIKKLIAISSTLLISIFLVGNSAEAKLLQASCICNPESGKLCVPYSYEETDLSTKKTQQDECINLSCEYKVGACPAGVDSPVEDPGLKKLKQNAGNILNPAGFASGKKGVIQIIGKAISFLLYPIGAFMMAFYIYAGFLWMTAQGNSENVQKAQKILVWTTLGVVASLASYLLVNFVFTEIL